MQPEMHPMHGYRSYKQEYTILDKETKLKGLQYIKQMQDGYDSSEQLTSRNGENEMLHTMIMNISNTLYMKYPSNERV